MHVRGSEVVVVAPAGEAAALNATEAEQFRSVFTAAAEAADTPAPGGSGPSGGTGTASTVKQCGDGVPPTVARLPASSPYRGGTTTPIPGPAANPALRGGAP
ncbi:hypothetical protein GCM10009634_43950 [Saccharothrix xinjiangensis]